MAMAALDALLASTPMGVALIDADGGVAIANGALAHVLGIDAAAPGLGHVSDLDALVEFRSADGTHLAENDSPLARARDGTALPDTPMLVRGRGADAARPVVCGVTPLAPGGAPSGVLLTVCEPAGEQSDRAALEESQAALRVLVADRERVQAEERRRIARDLHDDLQQSLAALNMRLGMAEDALDTDPAEAREWLQESQRNVIEASRATRRIIEDLRPQGLYHRPLLSALRDLVEGFSDRTGVPCDFTSLPGEMPEPPEEVADCIYRIAQESLTNIAKHADATQVHMHLERDDTGDLHLRVADDGRGLDEPTAHYRRGAYGLIGMSERVRALNGNMRISGSPGAGTTVEADIPAPRAPIGRE